MYMRKLILCAASALALASPAAAADQPVPYSQVPGYQGEAQPYAYETAPPAAVVEEPPPIIVRRPVIVAPPVVVDEYPVYGPPRMYAVPPMYAYAGPAWHPGWGHPGWGHRGHFRGGW
jgi:hypothetical protein